MPIYVYKNLDTGEYFEVRQSITDEPLKTDPETGHEVVRVPRPFHLILKGSGWYSKDADAS